MEFSRGDDEDLFDEILISSIYNKQKEYKLFAKKFLKSKIEYRQLGTTLCKYEDRGKFITVSSSKDEGKSFRLDKYRTKGLWKKREIKRIIGDLAWHDAVITTGM
jgi:hypothetical protein